MPGRTSTVLREALRAVRGAFLFVAVFSLCINLAMLIAPLYMLQVYDRVLTSQSRETLLALTALAFFLILFNGVLEVARSRLLVRIGAVLDARLSSLLFASAFTAERSDAGASASEPLRDLETLRTFLTGAGILAFLDAPWAPIYLALIFLFHPVLGMVALVGAILILALAVASEIAVRRALGEASRCARESNSLVDALSASAEAIRVMGMLPNLERHWFAHHDASVGWQAQASDRIGIIQAMAKSVRTGLQIAILGVGAWLVLDSEISAGVMVAASIIMGRALAPVEASIAHWRGLVGARQARRRLENLMASTTSAIDKMPLPAPSGRLVVQQVGLRVDGVDPPVLRGVTFDLEPGEILGLIGPSGAGKSSLARLVVGAYAPTVGSIRLDGAEIADWPSTDVGRYLGYLPQDVELLNGTVAQNIARFGELDPESVVKAAQLAGAHELILALPDGYETLIGAGGRKLSGGERQRIGLARAVYGEARLIVLDEPDANLDSDGETALRAALSALKQAGRTVIIITHKPSLLASADKLLVLRDGLVSAFGPRNKIMASLHHPVPGRRAAEGARPAAIRSPAEAPAEPAASAAAQPS